MANQSSSNNGGISLFGLLGVAFIVLKLCKVINWSWWLVTLPLWGGIGLILLILLLVVIIEILARK